MFFFLFFFQCTPRVQITELGAKTKWVVRRFRKSVDLHAHALSVFPRKYFGYSLIFVEL